MPLEERANALGFRHKTDARLGWHADNMRIMPINYLCPASTSVDGPANVFTPAPSSQVHHAPIRNILLGRRGRPGIWRGFFQFYNGAGPISEMGVNDTLEIREDITDGGDGNWYTLSFGSAAYDDPRDVASALAGLANAHGSLVGTYTGTYLDERNTSDPPFAFRLQGTVRFELQKFGTNNGIETLALPALDGYSTSKLGSRVLHTQEHVSWYLGGASSVGDGGPGIALGAAAVGLGPADVRGGDCNWFSLVDFNFDRVRTELPSFPSVNTAFNIGYGTSQLVLLAARTQAELEDDWHDETVFVEGTNRFTFVDDMFAEFDPDSPLFKHLGISYGTTGLANIFRSSTDPWGATLVPYFPAEYITAYLEAWPNAGHPVTTFYPYWRLHIVNRGNLNGRLSLAFASLDPSFYFRYNIARGHSHGMIQDPRSPARVMRWGFDRAWFGTTDHWQLMQFMAPRLREPSYPAMHAIQVSPRLMRRPVIVVDPTYDPLPIAANGMTTNDIPFVDTADPGSQMGGLTGWASTKYARGTILADEMGIDAPTEDWVDNWRTTIAFRERVRIGGR